MKSTLIRRIKFMKYRINKRYIISELALIVIFVVLDLWSKLAAVSNLKGKDSFVIIKDVLSFSYLENKGAAFGVLKNQQIFFMIVGILCAAAAIYFLVKIPTMKKYIYLRISIVLIFAGAVGNFIDRMTLNYVRDFIYFEYIDFPVFNVADIFVTCGTILLALLVLFYYKDDELDFKKHRTVKIHSSMLTENESENEKE